MGKKQALELLNSTKLQNKIIETLPYMSEEFMFEFEKKRYAMGEVDEWPNAQGEFGRTPTNPVLVNETWGEITYLSRLVTADGQRMIFHRVGSSIGAIDIFELVSEDGKFYDVLFLDMYHLHCSKKAPAGYTLLDELDGITGTSESISFFPKQIDHVLSQTALYKFGGKIVSAAVKNFDREQAAKTIDKARQASNVDGKIVSATTVLI